MMDNFAQELYARQQRQLVYRLQNIDPFDRMERLELELAQLRHRLATEALPALRAAHHELTLVNGCTATDLKRGTASLGTGAAWRVDAAATLAKIEAAMKALEPPA